MSQNPSPDSPHARPADPDGGSVRRALDEIVLSSLQPIAWVLAGLYLVFAVSHQLVLPAEAADTMSVVAVLSAAFFAGLALTLRRIDLLPSFAHAVATVMAAVVLLNSLLHMGLTREPFQTTNLLLLILGVGILFLDVGWFGLVVTASLLGWLLVAGLGPYSAVWVHFGFSLVGATVLSWAILALRIRTFRRLEELHLQDRVRQLELESALTRTEAVRRDEAEARRALEKAVAQLKESEERFRRLAEATFEGVVIHRSGAVADANRRAAELFGTSLPRLLNAHLTELFSGDSQDALERAITESRRVGPPTGAERGDPTGEGPGEDARAPAGEGSGPEDRARSAEETGAWTGAPGVEALGVRWDGTEFPAEISSTRATYRGEPATVTVIRDVTTHKRAEEALRQAARDAEASNRAKSTFLANMSHELRTPLNAVIGFSNILRKRSEDDLEPQEIEYLDRIVSNGKHLLSLIDDVLDLSKVEAGRMEIVTEEVDLTELVAEILRSVELQAQRKDVHLRTRLPEPLSTLETDPQRLRQVLLNLVGNAVKFTEQGSVEIRVVAETDGTPVRIEVADTGIGIPPDRLSHIFGAFQQVDGSTARRFGGTGLGLTISRSLCEIMGYELIARSVEGEGSTFVIRLQPPDAGTRPGVDPTGAVEGAAAPAGGSGEEGRGGEDGRLRGTGG